MLQIDHIYEFFYQIIFDKNIDVYSLPNGGVPKIENISFNDIYVFKSGPDTTKKILFYDQEPLISPITEKYINIFQYPCDYTLEEVYQLMLNNNTPYDNISISYEEHLENLNNPNRVYKQPHSFVTSEISPLVTYYKQKFNLNILYYFFHGFAALDWYRGHYALNHNKLIVKHYKYDFITFNRIINNDRSYRIYFVSKLAELGLLDHGQVSFNVTDNLFDDWRNETSNPYSKLSEKAKQHAEQHLVNVDKLIIDRPELPGSASADIPRGNDAFWHVVTETVFYYDKLHLTEKIFKPIVSKQPFMLLAAPGNLAYLRRYGFKTFDGIIDESYDLILDNDARIEAVAKQLAWYCSLSDQEKTNVMQAVEPIILHNFHHFYGEFRHIITRELLDNTKTLFKDLDHDDSHINYDDIYHVLTY
jgi:hypothetical protein